MIAHPGGHLELPAAIALLGGPALYLLATSSSNARARSTIRSSHLRGLGIAARQLHPSRC